MNEYSESDESIESKGKEEGFKESKIANDSDTTGIHPKRSRKATVNESVSSLKPRRSIVVFTFDYVFKKVLEYCEDQAQNRIRAIARWKISSSESFLKSLLSNNLDKIAR